jgi:hypothetical protein
MLLSSFFSFFKKNHPQQQNAENPAQNTQDPPNPFQKNLFNDSRARTSNDHTNKRARHNKRMAGSFI